VRGVPVAHPGFEPDKDEPSEPLQRSSYFQENQLLSVFFENALSTEKTLSKHVLWTRNESVLRVEVG